MVSHSCTGQWSCDRVRAHIPTRLHDFAREDSHVLANLHDWLTNMMGGASKRTLSSHFIILHYRSGTETVYIYLNRFTKNYFALNLLLIIKMLIVKATILLQICYCCSWQLTQLCLALVGLTCWVTRWSSLQLTLQFI